MRNRFFMLLLLLVASLWALPQAAPIPPTPSLEAQHVDAHLVVARTSVQELDIVSVSAPAAGGTFEYRTAIVPHWTPAQALPSARVRSSATEGTPPLIATSAVPATAFIATRCSRRSTFAASFPSTPLNLGD